MKHGLSKQLRKTFIAGSFVSLVLLGLKPGTAGATIGAKAVSIFDTIEKTITGKVELANGEPLPGASILVEGTTIGTVTDLDGNFTLMVPDNAVLVFSFIGYKSQRLAISNQSVVNIILEEDAAALQEVVVVGYGTQRKKDLTGAVASADIEAFRESPNVNIMQSLQGSVPGVRIGQVNRAGQEPSIGIRGQTTISGNNSPLIVVDGIIFRGNIGDINPADVASVEVLKDASSMAIYGAQAANGVILITTKGGKSSKKPIFTYSGSYATQSPTVNARLLNRDEFLQKVRDVEYRNAYLAPDYIQPNPSWDFNNSELLPRLVEGWQNGTNFDWWDALTSPGYISNHLLGVSGSSESTSYYISGGRTDQEGFIKNDNFSRTSIRINLETDINSWLTIGTNTFGAFSDFSGVFPNMNTIGGTSPLVTPFDENNEFIINHLGDNIVNPFLNSLADDKQMRTRLSGIFYGIVKVPQVQGLSYRINFSNNLVRNDNYRSDKYGAGLTGLASKFHSQNLDVMLDNIITYDRKFKDHSINGTFVYGFNKIRYDQTVARGENIPNLTLSYNDLQQALVPFINSGAWEESFLYQMGRLNYNFKDKYIVTATLRRDGFSGFSKNNKFALFPSLGLGWVISDEDFMSNSWIDLLKLRASYGQNGNQASRYSSLARVNANIDSWYVFGDGAGPSRGQTVASLANNDLSWEKTAGLNFGLDFALFGNLLKGNIEYYRTTTTDLLWNRVIPRMTGFSVVTTNIGEVANKGVELALQGTIINKRNFNWNLGFNIATNDNRIVTLLGDDNDRDGIEDDLVASNLFIGRSLGTIYGYEISGIWQVSDEIPAGFAPGNYKLVDQNGDGKITPEDDRIFLGRTEPAYLLGIQNSMNYKKFTFRFFINAIQGGKDKYLGANHTTGISATTGTAQNSNWFNFYDYWSPRNPDAKYSIPWQPAQISPPRYFSRSFVRLQDISLAYQVDNNLLQRIGIQNLKIFVSGKNLLTLTNWDGWDPESGQGIGRLDAFPVMKAYTFGIDMSF